MLWGTTCGSALAAALRRTAATRAHIAAYVRDLATRPNPHDAQMRAPDSGAGLANATLQQWLTAIRLYH